MEKVVESSFEDKFDINYNLNYLKEIPSKYFFVTTHYTISLDNNNDKNDSIYKGGIALSAYNKNFPYYLVLNYNNEKKIINFDTNLLCFNYSINKNKCDSNYIDGYIVYGLDSLWFQNKF